MRVQFGEVLTPGLRLYASSYDSLSRAQAAICRRCRNLTRPPRSVPNSSINATGNGQQSTLRWSRRSRRNASRSTTGTARGAQTPKRIA